MTYLESYNDVFYKGGGGKGNIFQLWGRQN